MIPAHHILTMEPAMSDSETTIWQLCCPECGEDCIERFGGDNASVMVNPDRDEYDSPIGTRGGFVLVKLFCPVGHGFDLVIANHKGVEFIGVKMAGARDYGDSDKSVGEDDSVILRLPRR